MSVAAEKTPWIERHPTRVLMAGLILVWLGVFLYLTQMGTIPAHVWWVYFMAGLGGALLIGGLLGSLSKHPIASEGLRDKLGHNIGHTGQETEDHPHERATQLETVKPITPEVAQTVRTQRARRSTFSGQLGIEHSALIGKKILFEFDPSTPYEKAIREFALECASNKETVIVLTPRGSPIRQTVEGQKGLDVVDLTPSTLLSPILEEHPERPLNLVYDSLSDLALSTDSRRAYTFTLDSLRLLSEPRISAIFLLNPSAHDSTDVSSLRGLFSNQVAYGKQGVSSVKFG